MRKLLTILMLTVSAVGFSQSKIPEDFFGVNAWAPYSVGDGTNTYNCPGLVSGEGKKCLIYGKFDDVIAANCTTKIKDLNVSLIRYGGERHDINKPTNEQYLNAIDYIRSLGAEPIIQVPYNDGDYDAGDAYDILYFLNVTMVSKVS